MNKLLNLRSIVLLLIGTIVFLAGANTALSQADDEMVARGEYLVNLAGCVTCHTPYQEAYADFQNLSLEDLQTIATFEKNTLDTENHLLAGGRPFDLGPGGVFVSRNLTPDNATGLGEWTDDEIKKAVRQGISRDGRNLHPLMPSHLFNNMAEDDLDAVIAYLRSIPAVQNQIPVPSIELPPSGLTPPEETILAPDPSDTAARGEYLVRSVLPCQDCHTPIDPSTGAPVFEKYLAGGQPFEGPWGIVYGGNITPHEDTGIGSWTDEEIERAITAGVRPDGRRLVLMPWQDYAILTPEDSAALLSFLRDTLPAVDNEVPAAALTDDFVVFVE